MKLLNITKASLTAFAASALLAGSASAATIAGWDFSQYLGPGLLTIDGASGTDTLAANYSNLDPTGGAGAESALFGTMYINGAFGSTAVDPLGAAPEFVPTVENLAGNVNAPFNGPGSSSFDNFGLLASEGQTFTYALAMTAGAPADVVFGADVSSVANMTGANWGVSFGARTSSGVGTLAIEFSLNGMDYTSVGTVNIDANDNAYSVSLGAVQADTVYIRMRLNGPAAGDVSRTILDNVSVNANLVTQVPEPAAALLVGLGLSMATVSAVRRRVSAA